MNEETMMTMMTITQAARYLNITPETLKNWEKKGRITPQRIGTRRDRRYSKADLEQFLDGQQQIHNDLDK